MKKAALVLLLAVMAFVPGCQCADQMAMDFRSDTRGLDRTIRLYDYAGHELGTWRARTTIDADSGGLTTFFDSTGARVLVNGGILVAVGK